MKELFLKEVADKYEDNDDSNAFEVALSEAYDKGFFMGEVNVGVKMLEAGKFLCHTCFEPLEKINAHQYKHACGHSDLILSSG